MISIRTLQTLLLTLGLSLLVGACAKDSSSAPAKPAMNDPDGRLDSIVLGMGCFWGAEKRMSELPGVVDVESGYANGEIEGSYRAILDHERALRFGTTSRRNHAEVVKVTYDPAKTTLETVLIRFWESHDPTQGDRQGNDVGSNYRSAIYTHAQAQQEIALKTRDTYQQALAKAGFGPITTEIAPLKTYHPAEEYHQDYLRKNPNGYCGLGGTKVKYPGSHSAAASNTPAAPRLDGKALAFDRQLVVFEAEDCAFCKQFKAEVLDHWQSGVPVTRTLNPNAPTGWKLEKGLFATPTIVLFEQGKEVSRYTGYDGDRMHFWKWLGFQAAHPRATEDRLRGGHRAPRHRLVPARKAPRHLRRSHHRHAPVPQRHQIRKRHRLAQLLQPGRRRRHPEGGRQLRHAARRSAQRQFRHPPGARLRRRTRAYREALLHQRQRAEVRARWGQ